ncbi:MAG: zinc ABC transporter substrate-binding protein [Clostridia bacterium]|nr:zinc ABC transporter substrate-binding protein [Clostridia bacterium]
MKKLLCLFILLTIMLSSCAEYDDGKTSVVATLFPQYDFAREIAGEYASVELLLDFGADAHSYDPTPADVMKIAKADLFIYTGDDMELWAKKLLESEDISKAIESGSLRVLDLSKHVSLVEMHAEEHDHAHEHTNECEYDSHIWTSVENATKICTAILNALCEVDPENEGHYSGNMAGYFVNLYSLKQSIAALKDEARLDEAYFGGSFAFRYMFDEIGIAHHSVFEGCSSHAEASAADIIKISDEIKSSGAAYVFYDSPSEKKIADALAAECGIEVLHLHAIHNITKEEFDSGETYISLMTKNIEALRKALS